MPSAVKHVPENFSEAKGERGHPVLDFDLAHLVAMLTKVRFKLSLKSHAHLLVGPYGAVARLRRAARACAGSYRSLIAHSRFFRF